MVGRRLAEMKAEGKFVGKFATQFHFFGYEGRCADPSNFDADYCYSLGYTAALLVGEGKTGYMSSVRNTTKPASEWIAGGRACDYDDEYGTSSRRNETCYTKSIGSPRWGSFQIFRRTS